MRVVRVCPQCSGPARVLRSRDVVAGRRRLYACRKCAAQWTTIEVIDGVGDATAEKLKAFEQTIIDLNELQQRAINGYKYGTYKV